MIIGVDVGGAHLKFAARDGRTSHVAFPLWRAPERLTDELTSALAPFAPFDELRVTMTGELCDCYANRREGVASIIAAIEESLRATSPRATMRVWTLDGVWLGPSEAIDRAPRVGAANWLALATWIGLEHALGDGLLIDIGSTTTDIIPIRNGAPLPAGRTDTERLVAGELVYTGVERTPICAVVRDVPLSDGISCPVAAELFATTLDAYLILGSIDEDPDRRDTADGRTRTREAARARIARCVCADRDDLDEPGIRSIASAVRNAQLDRIREAIARVERRRGRRADWVVASGSGAFLAAAAVESRRLRRVADTYGADVARSACAFALTRIPYPAFFPPAARTSQDSAGQRPAGTLSPTGRVRPADADCT